MIPFVDLKTQQERIRPQIMAAVERVLDHGQYIMGPEIKELEERLAEYAGVRYAVCCSSGTDGLLMALMAHGVGPGDAVFTTPFSFIATAEVIALTGATPVFVDIDATSYNIDPDKLEAALQSPRRNGAALTPRGVIGVDLFGLPADYPRINDIASRHGLFVIEDAAQSFGGSLHGKKACSLAHSAATSFFPAKPLGGYGDGGAVFTDDADFAATLTSLRIHGHGDSLYDHPRVGLNARMDTLQAAILLPKLDIFPDELEKRRAVAERYTRALEELPSITAPTVTPGATSAWAQYSIRTPGRDALREHLQQQGYPTAVYYPKPLHLQPAFADLGYAPGDMPVAEATSESILSLPMHPYLDFATVDSLTEEIARHVAA